MMTTEKERRLQYVLDEFDFEKVLRVMNALDWEWYQKGIPSIEMMKETVIYLAKEADKRQSVIGTGGFFAEWYKGDLIVHFSIASESSHWMKYKPQNS